MLYFIQEASCTALFLFATALTSLVSWCGSLFLDFSLAGKYVLRSTLDCEVRHALLCKVCPVRTYRRSRLHRAGIDDRSGIG
jgi:hypothetical protein